MQKPMRIFKVACSLSTDTLSTDKYFLQIYHIESMTEIDAKDTAMGLYSRYILDLVSADATELTIISKKDLENV